MEPRATDQSVSTPDEATDERKGYVAFWLGEQRMAVPMERVLEIIRVPETVAVPLGADCLDGLANLRGNVLPVVDLRAALGMDPGERTEEARVVVADCGGPLGLRVDRIDRVLHAAPDAIHSPEELGRAESARFLDGMIRLDGGTLVSVLHLDRLVAERVGAAVAERAGEGPRVGGRGAGTTGAGGPSADPGDDGETDSQFVVVGLADEEYAFPIAAVEEIVRMPADVSRIPGETGAVEGVTELRGGVLALVSLRRLFGFPGRDPDEGTRVLVVRPQPGAPRVGVVVDRVREVVHVPQSVREPVPEVLRRSAGMRQIAELCRLGDERLVSVVSVGALVEAEAVRRALEATGSGPQGTSGDGGGAEDADLRFVVFRLGDESYGVSVEAVQEIIRVPDRLTRVPRTPAFVKGLANLRGAALPVLDLRVRFGIEPAERTEDERILVLDVGGARAGFVVDGVSEVRAVAPAWIEPAPELSEAQARVIRRVVRLPDGGRLILLVEPGELVAESERAALGAVQGPADLARAA